MYKLPSKNEVTEEQTQRAKDSAAQLEEYFGLLQLLADVTKDKK